MSRGAMQAIYCPNTTEVIADPEVVQSFLSYPIHMMYGRKMCATCHGVVLRSRDGSLRKHKAGSNRS